MQMNVEVVQNLAYPSWTPLRHKEDGELSNGESPFPLHKRLSLPSY